MFKSFINTIKMEWAYIKKQKTVIIVIFIIPLIVNLLLGWEFSSNQIKHIPMAVLDQDNSSFSRMMVQQFVENEQFDVKFFPESSARLKQLLDSSKVRAGMIIPHDFYKDVVELNSPRILMLYDGSHMPIASAAKSRASEILMTLKTGILIKLIQAKLNLPETTAQNMALAVQFKSRTLYNPTRNFKNFLNPGMITGLVQAALVLITATAIRRHEMVGKPAENTGYYVGKLVFYSFLGFLSLIMSVLIQYKVFGIPFRGSILDAVLLSFALAAAVAAFGLMVSVWVYDTMLATQICAVIFVPDTVLVGYTWPLMAMPGFYQIVGKLLPFYHYADNLRDVFLKGTGLSYMVDDFVWFGSFIVITIAVSLIGLTVLNSYKGFGSPVRGEGGRNVSY